MILAHVAHRRIHGFTLLEVMAVLCILTVLAAFAFPHYQQWLRNTEYRTTARSLVNILRETRSRAISLNLEHRVEIEQVNKRYRVVQGDRATNSNNWSIIIHDWKTIPGDVYMSTNVDVIHINTNGTANGGTISIQDAMSHTIYNVVVARTGRVRIPIAL